MSRFANQVTHKKITNLENNKQRPTLVSVAEHRYSTHTNTLKKLTNLKNVLA